MDTPDRLKIEKTPQRISLQEWRLSDLIWFELSKRSFPLQLPLSAAIVLYRPGKDFPSLGAILFGFEAGYGPCSKKIDNFKQSFRFPFLLQVRIDETVYHLIWELFDVRGHVDFGFRRIIEREADVEKSTSVIVTWDEISEDDIGFIVGYLVGYIKGYCNTRYKYCQPDKPFYRAIPSELMLYGFFSGEFFSQQFEDEESFDRRLAELKAQVPDVPPAKKTPADLILETKAWIDRAKERSS